MGVDSLEPRICSSRFVSPPVAAGAGGNAALLVAGAGLGAGASGVFDVVPGAESEAGEGVAFGG